LIYINTFDVSWHFDDFHNIVNREDLHLKELTFSSITGSFFRTDDQGTKLYRPVACLSFALNWYFSKSKVLGYHLTNLFIHIFSGIFLFLFLSYLLQLPQSKINNKKARHFISLLGAILWVIHPIQTQAVTYIVQRMASMAGMFYILSMLLYIKARCFSPANIAKYIYFFGATTSFLLSVLSKQNAILLPFSILLIEGIFILDLSRAKVKKNIFLLVLFCSVCIFISVTIVFLNNKPFSFFTIYQSRPFSLLERALTEPRVLIYYLSLILYPVPTRLSLDHGFQISTSILSPLSTLPAIFLILLFIVIAVYKRKQWPLFSFAILFFFLNHLIESSIIPLELIFEHRNYIPSMFLFLPVAFSFNTILEYYNKKNKKHMHTIFICFFTLLIAGLGISTYVRNMAWFSAKHLWEDCLEKNPTSLRSFHNLAFGHYEKIDNYDKALFYYEQALLYDSKSNIFEKHTVLKNMASLHFKKKNFEQAKKFFKLSIDILPNKKSYYGLCLIETEKGNFAQAIKYINKAIEFKKTAMFLNVKGALLLKNSDPENALKCFQQSLNLNRNQYKTTVGIGVCFTMLKKYNRGLFFLRNAQRLKASTNDNYIYLADIYLQIGKKTEAKKEITKFLYENPLIISTSFLDKLETGLLTFPIHKETLLLIRQELNEICKI